MRTGLPSKRMVERAITLTRKQIAADEKYIQRLRELDRPEDMGDQRMIELTQDRIRLARRRLDNLIQTLEAMS